MNGDTPGNRHQTLERAFERLRQKLLLAVQCVSPADRSAARSPAAGAYQAVAAERIDDADGTPGASG